MTPALALFYGGLVRRKNVLNVMMMSLIAVPVVSLLWVVVEYSRVFSAGSPVLGSLRNAFLENTGPAIQSVFNGEVLIIPTRLYVM